MSALTIRTYHSDDEQSVVELWRRCGLVVPQNDPRRDIAIKCAYQPELFFVGLAGDELIATTMAGFEGHRGWINYLAVDPQHRRHGIGRWMMDHAEQVLRALGCPKINLQVRRSNGAVLAFYERIGFREDACVSLGKRLSP